MPPLVSEKRKKKLAENGSMNYRRLLFFFTSDNTGVRELTPYPVDKKTKTRERAEGKTTKEMCTLKPNCCHFMTFFFFFFDDSIILIIKLVHLVSGGTIQI